MFGHTACSGLCDLWDSSYFVTVIGDLGRSIATEFHLPFLRVSLVFFSSLKDK